jgi:hypothetical protein
MLVWNEGLLWSVITAVIVILNVIDFSVTRPNRWFPHVRDKTYYWKGIWFRPVLVFWLIASAIVFIYKWWPDLPR